MSLPLSAQTYLFSVEGRDGQVWQFDLDGAEDHARGLAAAIASSLMIDGLVVNRAYDGLDDLVVAYGEAD